MINKIKDLLIKYKEVISYLFFGVLTTAVDFVSYYILTRFLSLDEGFSNVLAQFLAIIFAYVTNKLFVFEDKTNTIKSLIIQFGKFFSLRLVTLVLNTVLFVIMIDKMGINDIVTKAIVSVIVIILNYVFSKLIVFKAKEKQQ
ncbi:MAG: GtrA family protein [Clostridia bacterium]|nr:GtrA family protein [Clostridia bacterium]